MQNTTALAQKINMEERNARKCAALGLCCKVDCKAAKMEDA